MDENEVVTTGADVPADGPAVVDQPSGTPAERPAETIVDEDAALSDLYDEIQSGDAPLRDASGRFASSASPEPAPDEATTDGDKQTTDQPAKTEGEQAEPAIAPPNSWSADMKAKWASLPPDVQQTIAARESEAHQQISRMGQEIASVKPLADLATQYQPVFAHHGLQPVDGIARLLDLQVQMDRDPAGTVARIAQAYGVDLAQAGAEPGGDQGQADPQISQLGQRIQQLEHQLAERDRMDADRRRQQDEALAAQAAQDVAKWSDGKAHYGVDQVRTLMATYLHTGAATTLDQAYEMAIYAVPDVRSKVLAEQEKQRMEERSRKVVDARRYPQTAARRAPIAAATNADPDSDDALAAVYERVRTG